MPEVATLGGGCFWCLQALMQGTAGVLHTVAGYAIQEKGTTEVVQLTFDPGQLGYRQLLAVFFAAHDPTAARKVKYRSLIAFQDAFQERVAIECVSETASFFNKPLQTGIEPLLQFEAAAERHQDYYRKDPEKAYCRRVILPRIRGMQGGRQGAKV